MGNPLFGNNFNGGPQNNMFNPFGGFMNFMNQFNQFRSGVQGNPQQMVQNMIQNGQMSQEQFTWLSNMATNIEKQITPFIRR